MAANYLQLHSSKKRKASAGNDLQRIIKEGLCLLVLLVSLSLKVETLGFRALSTVVEGSA